MDYYNLPTFSNSNTVNAVIEISAGTNKKFEYNKSEKAFRIDLKDGKERIIDFLPYPGNYGFIPSTLSDTSEGGDGDAIDVLVISESVLKGTVIEILPIGVFKLIDEGEEDFKIIAIPKHKENQIINVDSFNALSTQYPQILQIIEAWFLNYNKEDEAKSNGWGDEKEALSIITKSKL